MIVPYGRCVQWTEIETSHISKIIIIIIITIKLITKKRISNTFYLV